MPPFRRMGRPGLIGMAARTAVVAGSILDVAIARFEEFEALKQELEDTKLKLADRRDVEKAKGLLMKRRGLDEDTAYAQLRRLAMTRNLKMGDAARAIISAAELL